MFFMDNILTSNSKFPPMDERNELNTLTWIPIDVLGTDSELNIVLSSTDTYVE